MSFKSNMEFQNLKISKLSLLNKPIDRLSNDMKIAAQKNHLQLVIYALYRSLDPSKKRLSKKIKLLAVMIYLITCFLGYTPKRLTFFPQNG